MSTRPTLDQWKVKGLKIIDSKGVKAVGKVSSEDVKDKAPVKAGEGRKRHLESAIQSACVKWFDMAYPKLKLNLFSVPNEGARTPANGARMKAMGRRRGVADLFLSVPMEDSRSNDGGSGCFGLFMEMKAEKGLQSKEQYAFQLAVESQGYRYEVVWSFDDFKILIDNYLK